MSKSTSKTFTVKMANIVAYVEVTAEDENKAKEAALRMLDHDLDLQYCALEWCSGDSVVEVRPTVVDRRKRPRDW